MKDYEPTQEVRRKAEAAGIDLDTLKRSDPTTYAMLNAQRIVRVSPQLKEVAGQALFAAFPEHQVFDMQGSTVQGNNGQGNNGQGSNALSLLIFPPLGHAEMERLDDALAAVAAQAANTHAFYRVVSDTAGEHREFALPVAPNDWQGQAGVMVGPFASEAAAKAWSETHVGASSALVSDVLPHQDAWFCDLFWGDA